MKYQGGKHHHAKRIVAVLPEKPIVWEPFCGGLSVTVELAKRPGRLIASDKNKALITLYKGVRDGWEPPRITESVYANAKQLPDSDPLKAFCGFGCSFGGKWFGGYARNSRNRDYASEAFRGLLRKIGALNGASVKYFDFMRQPVRRDIAPALCIYADPPYANTTGYAAVGVFDNAAFWRKCRAWAHAGAAVYVSEYTCAVPHREVLSFDRLCTMASVSKPAVEKVFKVL